MGRVAEWGRQVAYKLFELKMSVKQVVQEFNDGKVDPEWLYQQVKAVKDNPTKWGYKK